MSTTKRLSVKAAKPQDQTCASKVQELTEAILADQTTGLSDVVDAAVYSAIITGTGGIKVSGTPGNFTYSPAMTLDSSGNLGIGTSSNNINTATARGLVNNVYPRMVSIKHAELDSHPIFQMTAEQLRAEIGRAHV